MRHVIFPLGVTKEKEDKLVSAHKQPKESVREKDAYSQLKSLGHYNRPQGVEAVLHGQVRGNMSD